MKLRRYYFKIVLSISFLGLFLPILGIAALDESEPTEIISLSTSYPSNITRTFGDPLVAIDSKGKWHLVYFELTTNTGVFPYTYLYEIKYLNSETQAPVVIASSAGEVSGNKGTSLFFPSIAVDPQGNIHIMYTRQDYTVVNSQYNYVRRIMYISPVRCQFEILDGADFSSGWEVSSNPEKLVSGGTSVEGAVTDGVTRLLLRLRMNKIGSVTFSLQGTGSAAEDGILRSIDGFRQGRSITVDTVEVDTKNYAFVIYQSPENFVRYSFQEEDKKAAERTLPIKAEFSSGSPIEQKIKLVRPPLILVHGLWSGPEMWNEFEVMLKSRIPGLQVFTVDYGNKNSNYFSANKDVPFYCRGGSIERVKEKFNSDKIAMIQADILGYSMGGLLSRIWAGAGFYIYERNNNFWMGDINKLITLDSPHYGSFFASVGMQFINDLSPNVREWALREFRKYGMVLDRGAVYDLMIASEAINYMNMKNTICPSHAIAGNYEVSNIGFWFMPGDLGWAHRILTWAGYDTRPFVVQNTSDLVVSVASQLGGLTWPALSAFGHHHMAVTTEDVANQVIELLNEKPNSGLFRAGFPVSQ